MAITILTSLLRRVEMNRMAEKSGVVLMCAQLVDILKQINSVLMAATHGR